MKQPTRSRVTSGFYETLLTETEENERVPHGNTRCVNNRQITVVDKDWNEIERDDNDEGIAVGYIYAAIQRAASAGTTMTTRVVH